jgi:photosystem II stability/assembly factor-like uncharacterized protein
MGTLPTNLIISFHDIYFTGENTGFVVGNKGYILKTTDGGHNWDQKISNVTTTLYDMYFTDASVGIAAGTNRVCKFSRF